MARKSKISTNPQPVRFDDDEAQLIEKIQKAAKPNRVSVSFIAKRAVRFAGPKFLNGEAPLVEAMTIGKR